MKFIRLSSYILFSLLCFGVAGYAFYYLSSFVDSTSFMAMKFANAGWEVYGHFFAAGLSLTLVPLQMSRKLRHYSKSIHKYTGYLYVLTVLIGGISGFIMSFNATGGVVAEWGFRMLSIVWLISTYKAIIYAVNGDIKAHKRWVYRSIALTAAAITLRVFLGVGLGVLHLPFLTVYVPTAWLCWVLNLALCEILIYQRKPKLIVSHA